VALSGRTLEVEREMTMRSTDPGPGEVDARRALTYVFDDERWVKKMLIGALFALGPIIIVGIFFLIGYLVEIVRRVSAGSDRPLPEWRGNFGAYFRQGFPAAWGVLIWLVPFQVIWLGTALVLDLLLDLQSIPVQLVFGLVMLIAANLYAAVLVPSMIGRYAASPRFRSMFQFGPILASIRRIGRGWVAVWIVHLAVLALTFITIWFIVGIVVTTAYAAMAFGHVYGQAAGVGHPGEPGE
jgi:hypothetical protein